jgi:uncharacterized membrane protein YeaQ/YmgE (transglycosylase-associated protein family)
MSIPLFLLLGLAVGMLARFVVPGREPEGWFISNLFGVGSVLIVGYLGPMGLRREADPVGLAGSGCGWS